MMRWFKRRPRRVVAITDVYGEPNKIAVLFKGEMRYIYMPKRGA